ncbi:SGNH/GDSL hydrolase family protein [Prochlorococcus sp. MIT 1341]|uniref:SGNH/GDSL hydrolase family protein n=1 Tax=Prochlorococcus sp. MIT 1341 TaxID=3096221 RepID=UPI002A74CD91|nr:SGNH/GDSL hydrolase family protein [Prochlorococcus sp. MIT 1341]
MNNYDVEMWRYSNTLKKRSDDDLLDFEHERSKSAKLQNVDIRLNNYGMRGAFIEEQFDGRRILFLGGSITLGWGVEEESTMTRQLDLMLKQGNTKDVQVLNAGVGNYNAARYTRRFFKDLIPLKPTDIVINYFLRDAENLLATKPNPILSNSQLALTLWILQQRLFNQTGENSLEDHYRRVYSDESVGLMKMKASIKKLSSYAKQNNIRLYLLMTPDIHNLVDYKFSYIHDIIRQMSKKHSIIFVDSLPVFRGIEFNKLYAMQGDPHPNRLGHKLLAETIYPLITSY